MELEKPGGGNTGEGQTENLDPCVLHEVVWRRDVLCACWLMGRMTSRRSGDGLASQPHQNAEGRVSVWVVSDGAARLRSSVTRVNSKPAMEAKEVSSYGRWFPLILARWRRGLFESWDGEGGFGGITIWLTPFP